jgi:hypothetical protein
MEATLTAAAHSAPAATVRTRYLSLLQVVGTLVVIAYHVGLRGTQWGWVAVELFFALAGLNMASAIEHSGTTFSYLIRRVRRMAPGVLIIWALVLAVTLRGVGTPGTTWFLITAPLFLENIAEPLFKSGTTLDVIYAPLWFVGALLQLQLALHVCRKFLVQRSPMLVAGTALLVGFSMRWAIASALSTSQRDIDFQTGDILYCLPAAHIEAITMGFLVGRGPLRKLGRFLPALLVVTLAVTLLNGRMSSPPLPVSSLGLDFPLRTNFMHLWGYAGLAIVAASLCSLDNVVAFRVQALRLPSRVDAGLSRLGVLTYGAYACHGVVIASGMNLGPWLKSHDVRFAGPIACAVTAIEAFLFASIARSLVERLTRRAAAFSGGPGSPDSSPSR